MMRITLLLPLVALSIAIVSANLADNNEDHEISPDVHGNRKRLINFFNEDVEIAPKSAEGYSDSNSSNSKPRPNKRPNRKKPNRKKQNKKKRNKKKRNKTRPNKNRNRS